MRRVTLYDRAVSNLNVAELVLKNIYDDVDVDIAAYHAQQCLELAIKYAILQKGRTYMASHLLEDLWDDLDDAEIQNIVDEMKIDIDNWSTTARYKKSINSSVKEVQEVIPVCRTVLEIIKIKYKAEVHGIEENIKVSEFVKSYQTSIA